MGRVVQFGEQLKEFVMIESAERVSSAATDYHQPRGTAGWAGAVLAVIALIVGAVALMLGPNWTLLWTSGVLLVLALATGSVLRRIGLGHS